MDPRRAAPTLLAALALAATALCAVDATPAAAAGTIAFDRGTLNVSLANPTSLAFGPDGRLYVASQSEVRALTLGSGGTSVLSTETIASGQQGVLGIAFDPTAPASPVVLYASRQDSAATDSYEGVVSAYTGPSWTRTDVITGLPSSSPFTNHLTNGLAFDNNGVLFLAQGSNTDAGIAVPNYPETPLSAAILSAGIHAPGFDGAITYDPSGVPSDDDVDQTGGDVAVYAPGTRNPYDLVVHTNGYIYATDNGPQGPTTSATCTTTMGGVSQNDELNLIEAGDYYGFPNRNRGRSDVRQCTYHSPAEGDGADFTAPIATLPAHCSCDGIAEYQSMAFGGKMQGDLLIAQFQLGTLARADLSADGRSVLSVSALASGFDNPLDVTVGPNGMIFVAEYGGGSVEYLVPQSVGGATELPGVSTGARPSISAWALVATLAALLATPLALRRR